MVANQKAVVWISTSLPIVFIPKQTGLLVNHSRIIVKVDAFNSYKGGLSNSYVQVPKETDNKFNNIGTINSGMLRPYLNTPQRLVLRALPIDSDGKKNLIHPYTVFIHEDLLDTKLKDIMIILATMSNIPSIITENIEENVENKNQIDGLCVEIVPIDNVVYRSLCREVYNRNIPTVLIPKSLNLIVNIENGMKIIFNIIGDKVEHPEHIDVITYTEKIQTEIDVIDKFKKCVVENTHSGKQFLINDGMVKQNVHISNGFLKFKLKPENLKYTMLNSESFRNCTVAAKCLSDSDLEMPKVVASKLEYDYKNYCRTIRSVQNLVEKVISHVNFEVQREASFKGMSEIKSNVLITGKLYLINNNLCELKTFII